MNKLHARNFFSSYGLLLLLAAWMPGAANATTTITSFTTAPQTVEPGQTVVHTLVLSTTASILSGDAMLTLLRDGVVVDSAVLTDYIDQTDIVNGQYQDSFSLPPSSYSEPGSYELRIVIEAIEDQEIPVSDSASTTFTVIAPTIPTAVSPASLSLSAGPGETAEGTFTIIEGTGPFVLSVSNGSVSQTEANVGDTVTYTYVVPPSATPGALADEITVTPSSGQSVIVPVSIEVTTPPPAVIAVSPANLSLVGVAGETPTTTFTITSGQPPFQLLSANDEGRGSFSTTTPGLNEVVEYGFRIPSTATDRQQFTDTITVIGADGAQAAVVATIVAIVEEGITQEDIDDAMEAIAGTDSQKATAATIATVCPSGAAEPQLQEDCNQLVGAALAPEGSELLEQAAQALGSITTDQVSSSLEGAQVRQRGQLNNIGSRITALRGGAVGLSARGLALNVNGQRLPVGELASALVQGLVNASGGGASADSIVDTGRWGVFINGSVSMADRDSTSNSAGYDADTLSLTLGADYRFRDDLIGGAAIGYTSSDTDIDGNGGTLDSDGYNLSLYGTYYQDSGLYLDGILTYGASDYDQRRNIRYTIGDVNVDQAAKADFDGSEWSASFGGGYQFTRGPWSFGPTARLEYIDTEVDSYSEKMSNADGPGAGWATRIESQDLKSFTSQIGGEVSYAVSTSWGVLLPSAQLEWVHEFEDSAGDVVGYYLQDTSRTAFSLATDDLDQNYFNLTLGVSATFAGGRTGFVSVRKLFGYDDLDAYSVNAGLRFEF